MARAPKPTFDVSDEAPITAWVSPAKAKAEKRPSGLRWAVRIYFILAGITLPIVFITLGSLALGDDPDTGADEYRIDAQVTEAQLHLTQWLTTDPPPVPGGRVASYLGSTEETNIIDEDDEEPAEEDTRTSEEDLVRITTHRFMVADDLSNLYTTSVQTSWTPSSGLLFLGSPSLLPVNPIAEDSSSQFPWVGLENFPIDEPTEQAIALWVEALTQPNPSVLKQTVGDPDPARIYTPVADMRMIAGQTDAAAALWPDGVEPSDDDARPERMIVRMSYRVFWLDEGQTPSPDGKPIDPSSLPLVTYDLLLAGTDTASPKVVAWANPGPVSQLSEYMNGAVSDSEAPVQQPWPRPTGSASPASDGDEGSSDDEDPSPDPSPTE